MDTFTARAQVLGPYVLQAIAMLVVGAIVVLRDGAITQDVVYGLMGVATASVISGGVVAFRHAANLAPAKPVVVAPVAGAAPVIVSPASSVTGETPAPTTTTTTTTATTVTGAPATTADANAPMPPAPSSQMP